MGKNTETLSKQANVELRGQRDQIINVVNLVKEIGFDLFSADKLAKDINYRRLLNIAMIYTIIFLLFVSICLTLWFRIKHSMIYSIYYGNSNESAAPVVGP